MSLIEFHKSISDELIAVQSRVRSLVTHWGEDGRHKEVALKKVIRRHLPKQYSIYTGFVVSGNLDREAVEQSKQIDVIIHDDAYPTLFSEGDFAIVAPEGVVGIIEVKTSPVRQKIEETIQTCFRNGRFICDNKSERRINFFNGLFYFGSNGRHETMEKIRSELLQAKSTQLLDLELGMLNHIAVGPDEFIKHGVLGRPTYSLYRIENQSFSFFISTLIEFTTRHGFGGMQRSLWYSLDKESAKKDEF